MRTISPSSSSVACPPPTERSHFPIQGVRVTSKLVALNGRRNLKGISHDEQLRGLSIYVPLVADAEEMKSLRLDTYPGCGWWAANSGDCDFIASLSVFDRAWRVCPAKYIGLCRVELQLTGRRPFPCFRYSGLGEGHSSKHVRCVASQAHLRVIGLLV